jgi:hypothetical protein
MIFRAINHDARLVKPSLEGTTLADKDAHTETYAHARTGSAGSFRPYHASRSPTPPPAFSAAISTPTRPAKPVRRPSLLSRLKRKPPARPNPDSDVSKEEIIEYGEAT